MTHFRSVVWTKDDDAFDTDESWAKDENNFLVKYQDGDTDDTLQAKYQAKVDELAKMRRSASPDAAKAELIFEKNRKYENIKN